MIIRGHFHYLTLRPFALARPLPRVPLISPRVAPPLPAGAIPPRLEELAIRDPEAGVANLGVALEDVGGLSMKDVSVVKNVVSPSISP